MKQSLPGQHGLVGIRWNGRGVPSIRAQHWDDVCWGLGYAHGRDRRFQMEMQRRLASGRLSEVFSKLTFRADSFMRKLDLVGLCRRELELYRPQELAGLQAYCGGVNFRAQRPWAMRLLGMSLTEWTPLDCLLWVKMMAFGLAANWEQELLRGQLAASHPEALESWGAMTAPPGFPQVSGQPTRVRLQELREEWELIQQSLPAGLTPAGPGSNAWAVSGHLSASGRPLLASDPHLTPKAPDSWYQAELTWPEGHVLGATMAGFPGVVIGQNRSLAWGATNSYIDVQDLFWEKIDGNVQERWEEIGVRGFGTKRVLVQSTERGPLLVPVRDGHSLSLAWTGHQPGEFFRALFGLNFARDIVEARQAMRHWVAPSLCYVLADMENIGYQVVGHIPRRGKGSGLVPVPAWKEEFGWQGLLDFEEWPALTNPESGFVVCANHGLGADLSWDFNSGIRAQRIEQLLAAQSKHDWRSFAKIQMDIFSSPAHRFAGLCARLTDFPHGWMIQDLRRWDGNMRSDSRAALLAACGLLCLTQLALPDQWRGLFLGPETHHPLLKRGGHLSRLQPWVLHWLEENPEQLPLVREALLQAHERLSQKLGHPGSWNWGRLHGLRLPFGRWLPMDGDADTPNQAGFLCERELPGAICLIGSFRMIAELGQPENCRTCHFPGQSGRWNSGHYGDGVEDWRHGRYTWLSARETALASRIYPNA